METAFRSCTPPQYIKALKEKETPVLLEERLEHFMEWLAHKGCVLQVANSSFSLADDEISHLIEEYVNG